MSAAVLQSVVRVVPRRDTCPGCFEVFGDRRRTPLPESRSVCVGEDHDAHGPIIHRRARRTTSSACSTTRSNRPACAPRQ
jgi:hypothetical protein